MSDDFFGPAFFDEDVWRDRPYRHRYVHGGFEGTDTRFAVWLPEPAAYAGRLAQFLQGGMGGSEHQGALIGAPLVAAENGALYVESNQGHIGNDLSGLRGDNSILAWRASAQSARAARALAAETYGEPPDHGYVFGGSGGAMRAVECLEAAPDLWDGAVPFMINRSGLLHYNWSIAAWAGGVLADRLDQIVDALEPGGGGDPFAVLENEQQRQALAALYRAGYCRGAESQLVPNPLWILGMQLLRRSDPDYFRDFFSAPGYEGADGDPTVDRLLVEEKGVVRRVWTRDELRDLAAGAGGLENVNAAVLGRAIADGPLGVEIDIAEKPDRLLGASLHLTSGAAAGRRILCSGGVGPALVALLDPAGFRDVAPGDAVSIENRDLVAFTFHHRHMVDARYPEMRQFFVDGRPIYTQRPVDFDRIPVPTGRFRGRMILLQHGSDRECWPSCAEPYVRDARSHLGARADEHLRVWWIENAAHLVPLTPAGRTRLINYAGCYAQAVRDLIAWVERGEAPPAGTRYAFGDSRKLELPDSAPQRLGIQPVVRARANGGARAEVRAGEPVLLEGAAEAPPGAGTIVRAEWDLDGSGTWPVRDPDVDGSQAAITSRTTHRYDEPGTWFATFRVGVHRDGDAESALRRITNLARVRIVVKD